MIKRTESHLLTEPKVAITPPSSFSSLSHRFRLPNYSCKSVRLVYTAATRYERHLARRSIRPSHPIFLADSPLATAQCATGTAAGVRHSERGRERSGGLHRFRQWLRWGGCRCGQTDGRVGPVTDPLHLTFLGVGKGRNKNNWGRGEREKGRQREAETRQR